MSGRNPEAMSSGRRIILIFYFLPAHLRVHKKTHIGSVSRDGFHMSTSFENVDLGKQKTRSSAGYHTKKIRVIIAACLVG